MITPEVEFAVVVEIAFKLKASPYTVTTRYFSQSGYEDNEIEDNGTGFKAYGLVRNISGLGSSCESEIPTNRTGTITLDNTRGSTGHNLRFSDWLDKEEIIAQSVSVKYWIGGLGETIDIDGNTEFVGQVLRANLDPKSNTIRLDVACNYFDISFPQYQINSTDWPSAAVRSLGQYLPIIFGTAIVPTYALDSGNTVHFGYATRNIGSSTLGNDGIDEIYARDRSGDWHEAISAAATSTILFGEDLDGSEDSVPYTANAYDGFEGKGIAVKLVHSSSTNYIVTSGFFYVYDEITNAAGSFSVSIIAGDGNGNPGQEIARATRLKEDFTWANDNSKDKIEFTFPYPVPLNPTKEYWLAFTQSEASGSGYLALVRDAATSIDAWVKDEVAWWKMANVFDPIGSIYYGLYGVTLADYTSGDAQGITCDQKTYGSLVEPDLSTLNLIVKANGLIDTGGGAISGTPSLDLGISAAYCIVGLASSPEITTYTPDTTTRTDYPRRIDGATKGRASLADICAQLCRSNLLKVIGRRNGDLSVWAYGKEQTSQATLSEDDCTLNSIDIPGTESIVNAIDIAYSETAIPLNVEDLQTGQPRSFEETLSLVYNTNGETAASSTDSFNLYGNRELNTGYVSLPFIRDDASAAFFAKYALTVYAKPRKTAELTVPFLGRGYDTLELMDLITLCHIDMPNEYGTSADGVTPFPVEDGIVNDEINNSFIWHEAKAYTCRIVSRKVNFNLDSDQMPTMDLKVQILDNPMEIR